MKVLVGRLQKYWSQYVLRLKTFHEYKLHLYSSLIKPIVQIIVLAFIWWEIFSITHKVTIAGMDVISFIIYLSLATFIGSSIHPWSLSGEIVELIKSGDILSIITKPVDYLKLQFARSFAEISFRGLYGIFLLVASLFVLHWFNPSIFFPQNFSTLFLSMISLFFGLIIAYLFYFIIACMTFWIGEVWSILLGIFWVQQFLSGAIIPLSISNTFLFISNFMPFKFMNFVPTFIFVEKYTFSQSVNNIIGQIIWVIIMYLIARIVLYYGMKKFEAQGG